MFSVLKSSKNYVRKFTYLSTHRHVIRYDKMVKARKRLPLDFLVYTRLLSPRFSLPLASVCNRSANHQSVKVRLQLQAVRSTVDTAAAEGSMVQ